ncbi:MAG: hypothetical protein AMJ60_07475, partial [Desulfobacterales bacterium SG8_35]
TSEKLSLQTSKVDEGIVKEKVQTEAKTKILLPEVKKIKPEVATPGEKEDEPEPEVATPGEKEDEPEPEVATLGEKEDEPEPEMKLQENLESTKAIEYARISVGANIRSDASMTSKVLHTVPPGYPVAVLSRQADWLLVEDYRERKGWVFASLVKEPKTVIIKTSKGNLRNGPSLEDGIIVQLDHEKIMPVLERSGEWLKVTDFEGLTGWLHQRDIWPTVVIY